MGTFAFEQVEWVDAELGEEATLGGRHRRRAGTELNVHRVSIGVPRVRSLTPQDAALDEADRPFVAQSDAAFHVVGLACSLALDDSGDDAFTQATLRVALSGGAVAWCLAPEKLAGDRGSSGFHVNGEISLLPGVKIGAEWDPPADHQVCWLEALGEQESDPEWRLTRQPNHEIAGTYRFAMVVSVPHGAAAGGTVQFAARIQHRGLMRRFRLMEPGGALGFELPAR